jgi:death-on-curing protein
VRYLTLAEVLELPRLVVEQTGGSTAARDLGALQSAIAQPRASFEGRELYPSLEAKASALCFSIVLGHPFVDGNKRTGHAALETFLVLNGLELEASIDESEAVMLALAAGSLSRDQFLEWVREHVRPVRRSEA